MAIWQKFYIYFETKKTTSLFNCLALNTGNAKQYLYTVRFMINIKKMHHGCNLGKGNRSYAFKQLSYYSNHIKRLGTEKN